MTKKNDVCQSVVNGSELIWDSWLSSFQNLQGLQNEIEEKSLQVFEQQKELLNSTRNALNDLEEKSKKLSNEFKGNFAATEQSAPIMNWVNMIEEATKNAQTSIWNPVHTMTDLFSKSQEQFEQITKEAVKQQQKGRTEALEKIEEIVEQMKQRQKEIVPTA
ncbi:hypothetical protein CSV79_13855 [Sporosarcina sp. P13]|uniref:hypothetical protein n=1 Tax=Sporosarcina sp. P13 TaxID=2048263 RepID=UPI000C16D0D4|nr:hypothetical protein [Sporosarcina sp. P13]PIC63038.1 hypothetical protein CSV79_13855 [Sporosarcina sp. P13]